VCVFSGTGTIVPEDKFWAWKAVLIVLSRWSDCSEGKSLRSQRSCCYLLSHEGVADLLQEVWLRGPLQSSGSVIWVLLQLFAKYNTSAPPFSEWCKILWCTQLSSCIPRIHNASRSCLVPLATVFLVGLHQQRWKMFPVKRLTGNLH